MFVHHFLMIIIAVALKDFGHGDSVWVYAFTYAEIPTAVLHISWFMRNIASNIQQLKKHITLSIKSDFSHDMKTNVDDIDFDELIKKEWNIVRYYDTMKNVETILLLIFAALFLYVRWWLHPRVYIPFMFCATHSPVFNKFYHAVCISTGILLCMVNLLWGLRIIIKANRDLRVMYKKNTQVKST